MIKDYSHYYFLCVLFLFSLNSFGQSSKKLIEVQNSFKNVNSISADFIQLTNGKSNIKGKFYFKKQNKMKLELKGLSILSDGNSVWNYNKKQNKVIISNYDESDPSLFTIDKFLFRYPDKCNSKDEILNGNVYILLIPKDDFDSFKSAKLHLTDKNELKKVSITDLSDNLIEFELKNVKYNPSIDDSEFVFTPPQNVKIVDLR